VSCAFVLVGGLILSKPIVIGLARHDCCAVPTQLILLAVTTMLVMTMLVIAALDTALWLGMPFGFDNLG
jgi:hypothetical protein